ncbi:alpha/beta hydrolase [Aureibaculum algae]|uniref:Alpha/beta hydrolase n=1 Tax=Aureibaculum algae TaxID=2584122 RepID=A0A5B7TLZ5_9FLAO|nr:alpha/beta hydrolase [Aureibaculum algae]QCX37435.1 alpha/beta hydrolase [Aureibaculum algae]
MNKIFLYLLFFVLPITVLSQNLEYKQLNNISYYDTNQQDTYKKEKCLLDIYYPKSKKKVPVIIWFHGGGLTSGNKEIPEALKNTGYCIVGVGYRLSPKVKAEKSIEDATAAVAWVLKNIEHYNGDSEAVFVSGHSAGGYLALMTVMDQNLLKKHKLDTNTIAGLIPFSGHTITHFTIRAEQGINGEQPIVDRFAPLFYVRGDAPPILLITGDRELEMLGRYEENAYFYRMMKVNGQKNISLYEMDGYGHNMGYPAFPLLLNFVKKQTKDKKSH